jgi:oligopeptide/dipeptide ABC transporter ATP-binding protein
MYLGRVVETGPAATVFATPRHPYTRALLSAVPVPDPAARGREPAIGGDVPSPLAPPPGCAFHTRCPHAEARCRAETPPLAPSGEGDGVALACWRWREIAPPASLRATRTRPDPALERLQAAFAR